MLCAPIVPSVQRKFCPEGRGYQEKREFKRSLVVTKLDFVEWSAFVFVTVQ